MKLLWLLPVSGSAGTFRTRATDTASRPSNSKPAQGDLSSEGQQEEESYGDASVPVNQLDTMAKVPFWSG